MKQRIPINRIIAVILTLAVLVTKIPMITVFAATGNVVDDALASLVSEVKCALEDIEEVSRDKVSNVSAGNWWIATMYDRLPSNFFHIAVQKDIINKHSGVKMEEPMYYKNEDGELTGEYGRADLYMEVGFQAYIWEVKPYSYKTDPNKKLGEQQLAGYVATETNYKIGDSSITGGVIVIPIGVIHTGFTEMVEYEVTYTVESNGLVIYEFKRTVLSKEPNDVKVTVPVVVRQPSKTDAISQILNPGYATNPEDSPSVNLGLDLVKLMAMVTIADAWGNLHDKINSHPSTNNSLSTAISMECKRFVLAVGAAGGLFIFDPLTANAAEINDAMAQFELAMEVYGGDTLIDELRAALEEEDYEKLEEIIKAIQGESDEYDKAGNAQPPRDPLVIDLGEEGITLCSISNGVNFDLDNNDFAEKTAWIGIEDGFLAYDRNGNDLIDNGSELFGDQVILSDGSKSISGFDALADMDENYDGVIDGNDSIFASLLAWVDSNHNGVAPLSA